MTDKQALILIDAIVANGIEFAPTGENKDGYFEGIVQAICAVFEVRGAKGNENKH